MLVPEGVKAGKISKPYGLRGELSIILEPQAGNHIEPDNPLFIDLDGQRVPYFVEEVELLSGEQAIIKFEFVCSVEEARELTGCSLYFDPRRKPDMNESQEDLERLVGYLAVDDDLGTLGSITEYISHPMNPILVIQSGDGELMIPAVRDFIIHIDQGERLVRFNLPEGITTV